MRGLRRKYRDLTQKLKFGAAVPTPFVRNQGVQPDDDGPGDQWTSQLLPLASLLESEECGHLRLTGLLSHSGQAYGAADRAGCVAVGAAEATLMRSARGALEEPPMEKEPPTPTREV